MFQNNPLLPYEQWNINFSELTVGAFVGSGKNGFWSVFEFHLSVVLAIDLQQENLDMVCEHKYNFSSETQLTLFLLYMSFRIFWSSMSWHLE